MILDAGAVVLRPYSDTDRDALTSILIDSDVMRLVLDERPSVVVATSVGALRARKRKIAP